MLESKDMQFLRRIADNNKNNVNPVIIKIEFARFCGASVGEIF